MSGLHKRFKLLSSNTPEIGSDVVQFSLGGIVVVRLRFRSLLSPSLRPGLCLPPAPPQNSPDHPNRHRTPDAILPVHRDFWNESFRDSSNMDRRLPFRFQVVRAEFRANRLRFL